MRYRIEENAIGEVNVFRNDSEAEPDSLVFLMNWVKMHEFPFDTMEKAERFLDIQVKRKFLKKAVEFNEFGERLTSSSYDDHGTLQTIEEHTKRSKCLILREGPKPQEVNSCSPLVMMQEENGPIFPELLIIIKCKDMN